VEGKKTDAVPALKTLVRKGEGAGPVHALWALQGLGALDADTLKSALAARDPAVRRNAIRALGNDAPAVAQLTAAHCLNDADAATRLAAFVKLAEFPTTPEITALVAPLANDPTVNADEWLREITKVLLRKHGGPIVTGKDGPNLLPNPSFETVAGELPDGWKLRHYQGKAAWDIAAGSKTAHTGEKSAHVTSEGGADTSLYVDLPVTPKTDYRLSGWIRTRGVNGAQGALLNVHTTEFVTPAVNGDSDWKQVETVFNSGDRTTVSVNLLFGGYGQSRGEAWFDDVKLNVIENAPPAGEKVLAGDAKRGEQIFYKHQTAACILCHALNGQGSTVGPALDGLATRFPAAYINESLIEPGKVLAKGYEALGASPMPPMGAILKPQELEDIKAFLQTLK
jgi:mono/diheme cytochrome c family protein